MIRLDAATVLLQWATGGLLFLWVTTRRRQVGIGYGWLLRSTYGLIAAGALAAGGLVDPVPVREAASAGVVVAAAVALFVSVVRRKAGVAGEHAEADRKAARVAAMTSAATVPGDSAALPIADPEAAASVATSAPATEVAGASGASGAAGALGAIDATGPAGAAGASGAIAAAVVAASEPAAGARGPEFPPGLDLAAPAIGVVGLIAAGAAAGGPDALAIGRTIVGALFLGAVSDAMLLGHWYLVQPGLARSALNELTRWVIYLWPLEMAVLLWPTGMVSVLNGSIDDSYGGMLGWFWVACALTTVILAGVTVAALRERYYSAVMAATGLLYLAILTAFGTDLVARAVLAGG